MRTVFRVLLWLLVFAGCAGIGAFVAAHTNPFPPGVEGSGQSLTASPTPQQKTWTLRFQSGSTHRFYYGGRCRSRWKAAVKVTAASDGALHGAGQARLMGRLICGFPNAQIQTEVLDLSVSGSTAGAGLVLKIRSASASPVGSHDYGGFIATILRRTLRLPVGSGKLHLSARDSTGKGTYSSETVFTLACTAGCSN